MVGQDRWQPGQTRLVISGSSAVMVLTAMVCGECSTISGNLIHLQASGLGSGGSDTLTCSIVNSLTSCAGGAGEYGALGEAAGGNLPGARTPAASWMDASGNLWLFGGSGYDASNNLGDLNDLWEFSPSTNEWTWMGGSNVVYKAGVYGTLGVPAAGNVPGSRDSATSWEDASGHFWLFGGGGEDSAGNSGSLNDLWEFTPSTNEWAWMGGTNTIPSNYQVPGVYGTLGTAAAGNLPGGRGRGGSWTDSGGNLWLFGGSGYDAVGNYGSLDDLWEFVPATKQWAWMAGSSTMNETTQSGVYGMPGIYGTLGTPAAGNTPGGREIAQVWTDSSGHLWLFGGSGFDAKGNIIIS